MARRCATQAAAVSWRWDFSARSESSRQPLAYRSAVLMTELNAWLQQTGALEDLQLTGNSLIDFLILLLLPVGLSLVAILVELTPAVDLPVRLVAVCAVAALFGWFYALTVSRHLAFRYLLRHTCWQGVYGDMVIWDNCGAMHRVVPYAKDSGRMMHRIALAGEDPIA
jgi:hypothetical protein